MNTHRITLAAFFISLLFGATANPALAQVRPPANTSWYCSWFNIGCEDQPSGDDTPDIPVQEDYNQIWYCDWFGVGCADQPSGDDTPDVPTVGNSPPVPPVCTVSDANNPATVYSNYNQVDLRPIDPIHMDAAVTLQRGGNCGRVWSASTDDGPWIQIGEGTIGGFLFTFVDSSREQLTVARGNATNGAMIRLRLSSSMQETSNDFFLIIHAVPVRETEDLPATMPGLPDPNIRPDTEPSSDADPEPVQTRPSAPEGYEAQFEVFERCTAGAAAMDSALLRECLESQLGGTQFVSVDNSPEAGSPVSADNRNYCIEFPRECLGNGQEVRNALAPRGFSITGIDLGSTGLNFTINDGNTGPVGRGRIALDLTPTPFLITYEFWNNQGTRLAKYNFREIFINNIGTLANLLRGNVSNDGTNDDETQFISTETDPEDTQLVSTEADPSLDTPGDVACRSVRPDQQGNTYEGCTWSGSQYRSCPSGTRMQTSQNDGRNLSPCNPTQSNGRGTAGHCYRCVDAPSI